MPYSDLGKTFYYYGESELEDLTDLTTKTGGVQNFYDIIDNCSANGSNFVDPEFPHDNSSLAFGPSDINSWTAAGWNGTAQWIRVKDMCATLNPGCEAVFNAGDLGRKIARNDIQQGDSGDCWFLCSVAAVSMVDELIKVVVPADNKTNDSGVYHFRFWYEGCWVDIPVDDYIPVIVYPDYYFSVGANPYVNNNVAEFWGMLVEKAYAKLNATYHNMDGNSPMLALENLTGGFGQYFPLQELPSNSFEILRKWFDRSCVVSVDTANQKVDVTSSGIVTGHAYSVTGAHVLTYDNEDGASTSVNLMRLRNPWGNTEWNGDWSDSSSLWNSVSAAQKESVGYQNNNDGEFLISYDDFLLNYADAYPCWYKAEGDNWDFSQFHSKWSKADKTAGGFDSPWQNPLYTVTLTSGDGNTCNLIVGTVVDVKIYDTVTDATVCLRAFAVPEGSGNLDENFFNNATEVYPPGITQAPTGNNSFSVGYDLPPGQYVIVPCTINAGEERKICVRIMTDGSGDAQSYQQ